MDLVIFCSPYKRGELNLWQSIQKKIWILNPLMWPVYVFTPQLIYISMAAGKYESKAQETTTV